MPALLGSGTLYNLSEIRQQLDISQEQLSRLLRVSAKTVSRCEKEGKQPRDLEQRQRLAKLQEIIQLGQMVYTPAGLKEFLSTPLAALGSRTGFDLIQLGEYEPILSALASDFEGSGF